MLSGFMSLLWVRVDENTMKTTKRRTGERYVAYVGSPVQNTALLSKTARPSLGCVLAAPDELPKLNSQ